MIFVTAIYDNNYTTVIGGRGRGLDFFHPTLINIGNLGYDLVLYCSKLHASNCRATLAPYFKNLYVIEYELDQFIHFKEYIEWKRTFFKDVPNDRNEILCFNKLFWVRDAIERNLSDDDVYMWIDAGLPHHGIIPEKVGGVELLRKHPKEVYYPDNPRNVFNPKLGKNLLKSIQPGKLFYCSLPSQGDNTQLEALTRKAFDKEIRIVDHLVGGIFGGYKLDLLQILPYYESILKESIDSKVHCFEEHLFNCLYAAFPNKFSLQKFDVWWFYSPGEITSYLTEDANSFYKIFTRIHEQE